MTQRIDDLAALLDERYRMQSKAIDATFEVQQITMKTAFETADKAVEAALTAAKEATARSQEVIDKRFEFVNEAFAEALGYNSEQLVGHPWDEVILEDDQAAAKQTYQTMLETGKSTLECRLSHRNGKSLRMDLMLVKRKAADNTCAGHFCFCKALDQDSWAKAS